MTVKETMVEVLLRDLILLRDVHILMDDAGEYQLMVKKDMMRLDASKRQNVSQAPCCWSRLSSA